ncbi:MAG: thioredoxin-like domain-containing protein [bacterium]
MSNSIRWMTALVLATALVTGCKGSASAARSRLPNSAAAVSTTEGDSSAMPKIVDLPKQRALAPEFPKEFAWVNTDRPLYIRENLRGNVVVLDFWTYCCINCMHILPDLAYIEHKYAGQPVMVIGVHSAKFDNEGDKQNIETACERYNIAHPVIVDEQHRIWSAYSVRAWPTLVVIDPEGRVVGSLSGEGNRETLDAIVYSLLQEGREKGTLAAAPPVFERKGRVPSASGLAFPGKVLVAPSGRLIFISDSNHDRVIVADPMGEVVTLIGSGKKGSNDGEFNQAEFNNPQGLAYDGDNNLLYVADTDNHLIRRADLSTRMVSTLCGTGKQVWDRAGGKAGREQGLNSPWDLTLAVNRLYVAMAGNHQIWSIDLDTQIAEAWVGSGAEDIEDGRGLSAALAQPSGIVRKGDWLYFADSEVSAVRRASLEDREVQTLIGHGLFDFGDRIGSLSDALLQHPLGVAVEGDDILVADTYNHKIKRIRESRNEISEVIGRNTAESTDGSGSSLQLYEPGGLSVHGDTLYVADTNHDRIIKFHLSDGGWKEFRLKGLQMEKARRMDVADVPVQEIRVRSDEDLTLRLSGQFPNGIHLNSDAPINYAFVPISDGTGGIEGLASENKLPLEVHIPAANVHPGTEYQVTLSIAYCTDASSSVCVPVTLTWRLKILEGNQSSDGTVELTAKVKPIM